MNKSYTILIASNRDGATTRLVFSSRMVKLFALMTFVVAVAAVTASFDYFGLLLKANENRSLKAENAALKSQFVAADEKLTTLESSIERIQNFTKKLDLITNVQDEERALKLAMSEQTRSASAGMAEPAAVSRMPSSAFTMRDSSSAAEKLFADEKSGELGVSHETSRDYSTLSVRIDRALRQSQMREQGVLQIWDSISNRQSLLSSTPSIKPTRGWSSSGFGYRPDPITNRPAMHSGLDLSAPPGTPVYAPADGTVLSVGYDQTLGKVVTIDHGYGVITRYGHSSRVYVEPGQKVHRWDVISSVGNSGRSTSPNLYYEVRVHGLPVDPANYILTE